MFFIVLIVSINFVTINNSSKQLIKEKIESNISFLEQLLIVPISVYDLATLDNLVENTKKQVYINSIVILDKQNRILSKVYDYAHLSLNELLTIKQNKSISISSENYEIRIKQMKEDESFIGTMYIIFDTSESSKFIKDNQTKTIFIIIIEILISTILAYFIGSRLTNMLTNLTQAAKDIGDNKQPLIPYQDKKDEIGTLSKSMNKMQIDLKTRNRELQKQKIVLEESNRYKDEFLANMSHELKTPLNSIHILSSVMAKNSKNILDEEHIKNLKIITKSGDELLLLINDILDVSKIEAGELSIELQKTNITMLINDLYDTMKPIADKKNILLQKNTFMEETIISDSKRIKQILQNLLSNAIKFTNQGVVKLNTTQDSKNIIVEVIDSGIGIPLNKIEHIFDRFKQVDGSTTRKYGGTGLGLCISKELSHLIGGELSVISQLKEGSIFKLVIPKKPIISNISDETIKVTTSTNFESLNTDKVELFEDEKNIKKEKTTIYLNNNNPAGFFSLIIALKKVKEIELVQIKVLDELLPQLDKDSLNILILDIDSKYLDISKLINSNIKLVALSSNAKHTENIDLLIQKPIDNTVVIKAINKLKEGYYGKV